MSEFSFHKSTFNFMPPCSLVLADYFMLLVLSRPEISTVTFKGSLVSVTVKVLMSIMHCDANALYRKVTFLSRNSVFNKSHWPKFKKIGHYTLHIRGCFEVS